MLLYILRPFIAPMAREVLVQIGRKISICLNCFTNDVVLFLALKLLFDS
jgi:hypothetical protein